MKISRSMWMVVLIALSACSSAPFSAEVPRGVLDPEIAESSGLIRSSLDPDLFWTLSDSGNEPVIYAIDLDGTIHGRARLEQVPNIDWEALTSDFEGHLYIGEIGNNANDRRDLSIHVIREPNPQADQSVAVLRSIPVRFPDQTAFPDPMKMNFDAEALFWSRGYLYLLSKHRSDSRTKLYRIDPRTANVTLLDEIEIGSMVTDAALSSSGVLAVLTYAGIRFYDFGDPPRLSGGERARIDFATGISKQSEAIAWVDDSIVFTNEQRDIHYLAQPLSSGADRYPQPVR